MATRAAGAAKAAGAAGAAGDTVALGAAPCRPLPPFPPWPPLPRPTAQTASTKTATPGTKLHPITARTFALPDASRYHAASGPSTAPAWSIPRCSPNARPASAGRRAGRCGYITPLAKSWSNETAPNSFTWRGRRPLIQAQAPAHQRDGQAAVAQHGVVERTQREHPPARRAKVVAQPQQLPPPHGVAQLVRRLGAIEIGRAHV